MIFSHIAATLICWLLLWPALLRRFDAPRPQPAPRTVRRQWGAAGTVGGRLVAVRLQLVVA